MIITHKDGTKEVYCDRCSKLLTENIILMNSGDVLCKDCLPDEYKEMTVEEYLND